MVDEASGHPEQSGPDGASAYQPPRRLGFPEDGYLSVEVVGSVILTTNRNVASWGDIFSDSTIAAAMLDRLLHRSVVFTITADSYRLRAYQAQARKHRPKGDHH